MEDESILVTGKSRVFKLLCEVLTFAFLWQDHDSLDTNKYIYIEREISFFKRMIKSENYWGWLALQDWHC